MPKQTTESEDPGKNSSTGQETERNKDASETNDAFSILHSEHNKIKSLLDSAKNKSNKTPNDQVKEAVLCWIKHSRLEEDILISALTENSALENDLQDTEIKRDLAKILASNLMIELEQGNLDPAKFRVFDSLIRQLFEAEAEPVTGLFARVKALAVKELPAQLSERKQELANFEEIEPVLKCLSLDELSNPYNQEETKMSQQPYQRERDSQGRFVSENDRRSDYRSHRRDDDERRSYRDDYNDDRRSEQRHSRGHDDDRRHDRGQGGWFGDPEGHSEASRRGWDERRSSNRDYDDNMRGSRSYSRSRDDDDRRYSSRDDDYRRSDRGQSGWYGDPQGHSEAARRGWDERRASDRDYDDNMRGERSYGRSRDDDERRYSSRDDDDRRNDRGQGGWFGDPQGHAAAARRGWQHRDDH
ncbi:hypothetical protein [Pseudochelatococcus sp. G4_1912]|uniref:hypothetical protein n=1 Tax=Pseudochelatococcus sp. G4_1912 TaxID=3114288 RepID=UPI0039C5ED59